MFVILLSLAISLCGVVAIVNDEVLWAVVVLATKVTLKNSLCAVGITLLGIERSARHVRDHGVAATERVLGRAQRVVTMRGLGEPDVTAVTGEISFL